MYTFVGQDFTNTAYTGAVCMGVTVVGNTTNLPLSDPFCATDACLAFKKAHAASQAVAFYNHQFDYGHYTTWYYLAVLGVGAIAHAFRLYRNRKPPQSPRGNKKASTSVANKAVALVRSVNYRSVGGARAARWGIPEGLGITVFLLFTFLFFLLLTFLVRPYYRQRRGYGSPPLAVRTGLMSTALTPIIVALSGKVNIVTWLTGVSHEKLNVLHRWTSYLCLFLAIVHTVPFIVVPLQTCGSDGLRAQFYKTGAFEYTGIPPFGILVGLAVFSIPFIRHHFYNLFYRLHILMYITYLGLMFWHAGQELDSWAYLWATLAIWLFSVAVRLFYKWQTFSIHRNWFSGFSAAVQDLPGDMTQVTVLVPSDLRWKAGQHCWVRMPHLSILENHPFTIANLPGKKSKNGTEMQDMKFFIRAHRGLTLNLLEPVTEHKDRSLPMHIDGPYGGLREDIPALYESLVFVAGGSGISACLPHMLNAALRIKEGTSMVTSMHLVWMVRQQSHLQWVLDELKDVVATVNSDSLHLDFYVTNADLPEQTEKGGVHAGELPESKEIDLENKAGLEPKNIGVVAEAPAVGTVHDLRPFLPVFLPPLFTQRRVFVFGCGPASLRLDLRNAVAASQKKVLDGHADVITLDTEMFGW